MRTLAVAFLIVVFTPACQKASSDKGPGGEQAEAAGGAAADPSEALGRKLNPYVVCLNSFSRDVFSGRHSWFDSFGEKGPEDKHLKRTPLYGPRTLGDPKTCVEGVAQARAQKPSMPELESAGDAYVAALQELVPLYAKSNEYFEQENYKDDQLGWAKAQHPVFLAAWAKFSSANDKLEEEVDALEDQIAVERLAFLEKSEGKKFTWHHQSLLVSAKRLVRRAGMIDSPEELELEPFQKDLAAYETALTAVTQYYAANKKEVDEQARAYWTVEGPAKELLSEAKSLMRRKRDNDKFSTGERMTIRANNAEAVDGHPAAVVKAYNDLITRSNGLF